MEKEMKTKSKISGYIIRSGAWAVFSLVALIACFLLFVAMPAAALAVDAVWNTNPSSSFWNDGFNWSPPIAPVNAGDTATFNSSMTTSLSLSSGVNIDSMTFDPGASAFSIDTSGNSFSFLGHGIVNNSGTTQTIQNEAGSTTNFLNSSTAANASITSVDGGSTNFFNSSTAANAGLLAAGGYDWTNTSGGSISFSDNSTASNAGLTAQGGFGPGAGGGSISFSGNSTAGNATLIADGGGYGAGGPGGGGGGISFSGDSTADNATLTANPGDAGSCAGISFHDTSTAGNATLTANGGGGGSHDLCGADISFGDHSTAGNATITSKSYGYSYNGGVTRFVDNSTGGTARVEVFDLGYLDISSHESGLSIGSIEGSGNVFLGANNLTVGTNGINTSFSGVISGRGLLVKVGSGVLTLQANDCIADTVGLILVSGSIIKLDFTGPPDVIASLNVNGVSQPPGIYGSPTSGAPHQLPEFAGPGTVQVVGIVVPLMIATNAASNLTSFSATLNGTVNPNGLTTNVHFEYGTTTSYGSTTASHSYTGRMTQGVTTNIAGLSANTTYHFRLVGTNIGGTAYGSDKTFTLSPTGPPVATTTPASNVLNSSATLHGSVNPHGLTTTVYFQYGKTTAYGSTTASQTKTGNTYQAVSANISGLVANSAYHFRIVATNTAGTTYGADSVFMLLPEDDFNNDGHPDYLLYNASARQTVIWYMSNNVHVSGNHGPTLPGGWDVAAIADFNLDSHPDYLLFNPTTRETVIWYMNNNVHFAANHGPTLPAGWDVVAVADFNLDSHPDYLLFNPTTRASVIWYMNNNIHVGGNYGPTLPGGWEVAGVADFNSDDHPDYLLFNRSTRGTVIWYMNNNVRIGGSAGPTIPAGWSVVAP
jgi:FG-GAP-like repeat